MTLAPRPDWADKYAKPELDTRFFDIAALMERHQLSRALAVELQNHFRDLARAEPDGDRQSQYAEALRRAKAGEFEDHRDLDRLAKAPFIVVFDLDETLYDQHIRDPALIETCADLSVPRSNGKTRHIKLNPGWADAIERIHALGGAVVLFSANLDDTCYANAAAWTLGGVPLLEHPAIAGMLTNSHLVLQPKQAGDPVSEPSKDLRIVDPDLSRTIIVDDNPRRLFQFRNVRVYKKFLGEAYCRSADPAARAAHEGGLPQVMVEIEDALAYVQSHPGTGFAHAYLPYTTLGRLAVNWLQHGTGMKRTAAIEHLRAHPELADEDF
ncbi:MAG: HAD family hydrolase [Deltaproteobacteria bacterium]|nr:HAD family hydrolase [Deltaproteobacteria bacterium]